MTRITSFIIAAVLCTLLGAPLSAYAHYSCGCILECDNEINDIDRLEEKLAKLQLKLGPLEDRLAAAIEYRDSELEKYEEQLEALQCNLDRVTADGEALLENFLNDPSNAECGDTCVRYMRLKSQVDKQICRAQKAYDRWEKKRPSLLSRLQAKVDRLTKDLDKLRVKIADVEEDLNEARDAYNTCRIGQMNIGCICR